MIKVEKYEKLILNHNVISYYSDITLKFIVNQEKYFHNDTFMKTIKKIHI